MKVDQDLKIKIVGKMPAGLPHFVLPVPWWTQRRAPSMSNTWDDLDLSGGFQRCERGQVKRTFVVNGFGDHPLESCYCTQYYCWWLFYPALANPSIGSYFSHSCVHSKCSTKSWIPLNKVHFAHLGSIYLHCCFGVWHFVILVRSGTFAWSHTLIFWKMHIAYHMPDFWQVNEIVWLLLKTTTTERFRSRLSAKKPELSVPMAILFRTSPTSCLVHFIAYGQQFWKNSNVRFCDLHVDKTSSHVSFICNICICFGCRCKAARTGKSWRTHWDSYPRKSKCGGVCPRILGSSRRRVVFFNVFASSSPHLSSWKMKVASSLSCDIMW